MIYVCIPVHNEAHTVGLVLWKVRQVFAGFPREYHLLVCDDGSADGSAELLASYAKVLPMTVITHAERRGYTASLEELLGLALQRTDRPRRDCAITLHADFSHPPDAMVEMVRHLESGADVVVAELLDVEGEPPAALRWARRAGRWLLRVPGVRDSASGFVALRLAVWRQAQRRDGVLLTTSGWSANAELLARLAPFARRIETFRGVVRYDLVQRPLRTPLWRQLVSAWRARKTLRTLPLAALLAFAPPVAHRPAQSGAATLVPATEPVPFPVGERLVYAARYGVITVGEASLQVVGLDTVRGTQTVHFRFHIQGSALWYKLDQTLDSWVGQSDFVSRRYWNETHEKGKFWENRFEIFPDSGVYQESGHDSARATVANPLDDTAFLYWIRTVPLQVGQHYEYRRYFRPERNPVVVDVLGHERVNVAGHDWNAVVLSPKIPNGGGIFAERAEARMWLSDSPERLLLALQSKFSFGTVTLKLKEFSEPDRP
ncbi:MAG TPA: DUF3108 domain-containing protein [Gemmatimonadales bacterium]|nr:DUF3108 domain-containing protein [Gemmatimonadales bacterium]